MDANGTMHALGGFADNGEANAGANVIVAAMEALEHFEESGLDSGVDADAVVFDPKADV